MCYRIRRQHFAIYTTCVLCLILFCTNSRAEIIEVKKPRGSVSAIYTPYGGISYEDLINYFKTAYISSGFKIGTEDTVILRNGEESLGRNTVLVFDYTKPDIPGVVGEIEFYFGERFIKQGECAPCMVSWIGKIVGEDETRILPMDDKEKKELENRLFIEMKISHNLAKKKIIGKFGRFPEE